MKKLFIFIFVFFIFLTSPVDALTVNEIKNRNKCPNIELAIANSDKTLTHVKCFDNYQASKKAMDDSENLDSVLLERKNNETRIIDAKLALVYLDYGDKVTYYYEDSNLKTSINYMNHSANYGATDGVFLGLNYANYAALVKVNGITGWLKQGTYRIIPLNFTGSYSYYQVSDSGITHYYSKNIENFYTQSGRTIDKKPSFLSNGRYYSHDGIYFYKYASTMIQDYRRNTYENSVNYKNPYYNYYMYLPHRGISNYSADDIDAYLRNNRKLVGTVYGKKALTGYSNMYQTGIFFKSSENLYGANAILMMSLATNESGVGQSAIAVDKNNLFGHAAYDSSAYSSATGYLNPYQSIIGHANKYINCGYSNPKDSRFYGSNVGGKASGMNVKYASDPYWGEKVANYYYSFDKDNGFLDYNYYQLGVTTASSINTRVEPNMLSAIPFNLKYANVPVIILGEVDGASFAGSTKWYKIVSDANLTSNRTSIQSCAFTNYYNYNSYVYVHSSLIRKINQTTNGKYNTNQLKTNNNYTYSEYSTGALYNPKAGLIKNDAQVYETATLAISKNLTIKKGHYTTVFMEALNENKQVVAYLVTVDYSKNQKGWVAASDLSIVDKDILKVNINAREDYLNIYKKVGGEVLGKLYDATYTVILEKQNYNNDLWLKVHYGVDNTYGYINTNISTSKGSLEYTLLKLENRQPTIEAYDKVISLFTNFNPKEAVTASDPEDGDLTSKIEVVKNTVDTNKVGTYEVSYKVSDTKGLTTVKTIKVEVQDYKDGNSLFLYESLKQIEGTTIEVKGFLGVKSMDNINMIHYLKFINETDQSTKLFKLESYKDYPYEMSSLDDSKSYNYSGGWFKGKVSLSKENLKQGNYTIKIIAYNVKTGYKTETYFTNIAYGEMTKRIQTSSRGIAFDIDYSYAGSPLLVSIRDNGLLSYDIPPTNDPMYNFFTNLKITNKMMSITGISHNANISYSKNDNIKRSIIFENTTTFEKIEYEVGYIDNGLYQVSLPVSDQKDKTRAWFKKELDLSKLKKGNYAIYLKTTSNNKTYYGELLDVAYTNFKTINTNDYEFRRVDEKRLRVELNVKS